MGLESTILGIAQDGGIPQASLSPSNWQAFQRGDILHPVSLGVKTLDGCGHLFDVTRSLSWQLALWQNKCEGTLKKITDVCKKHISQFYSNFLTCAFRGDSSFCCKFNN